MCVVAQACRIFMRFAGVVQEVQQAETFLSPQSLHQNLSTLSEIHFRTSVAATKHKYLQQDLQLSMESLLQPNFLQARVSMKQRLENAFAGNEMVSEPFSR